MGNHPKAAVRMISCIMSIATSAFSKQRKVYCSMENEQFSQLFEFSKEKGERRLAGASPGGHHHQTGNGCRHRWLHRNALRAGLGEPRYHPG